MSVPGRLLVCQYDSVFGFRAVSNTYLNVCLCVCACICMCQAWGGGSALQYTFGS